MDEVNTLIPGRNIGGVEISIPTTDFRCLHVQSDLLLPNLDDTLDKAIIDIVCPHCPTQLLENSCFLLEFSCINLQ